MMIKKIRFAGLNICMLCCITLMISGCFLFKEEKKPLRIGVVISQTFDDECEFLEGFDIGVSEYYKNPINTEIIAIKAVAPDTLRLHNVLDSLILGEKVDLLYGFDKLWMLEETAFYTRKKNVPIFTPWIVEPFRRTADFPNVFYCKLSRASLTNALAEYAVDRSNSWAFIEENVPEISRSGNLFVSRFTQFGGAVLLREDVRDNELDSYSLKRKYNIVANKPDNYYVAVSKDKLESTIRDLNNLLNQNLPIYCDTKLDFRDMITLSKLYQGQIFFYSYMNLTEVGNENTKVFEQKYLRTCGHALASDTPAVEYDFVKFVMRAHRADGDNLRVKLANTTYNGISGKFRIDSKDNVVMRDIGILEMINGRVENFMFLTPQTVN